MKRNVQVSISLLSLLSLILITTGVSYSFVGASQGKQNTDSISEVQFLYTGNSEIKNGLSITAVEPLSDSIGKNTFRDAYAFDFKIVGQASGETSVPYQITLRKGLNSTMDEDKVKVYLTTIDLDGEHPVSLTDGSSAGVQRFQELEDTALAVSTVDGQEVSEKTLYQGRVMGKEEQKFRLRMWVADDFDWSTILEPGQSLADLVFSTTVQVYTVF